MHLGCISKVTPIGVAIGVTGKEGNRGGPQSLGHHARGCMDVSLRIRTTGAGRKPMGGLEAEVLY